MKLGELARDYLRRAEVRVRSAAGATASKDYPDAVRFSQEAVELSLKAALRAFGVEYPKEHDVGGVLRSVGERYPTWFRDKIDELAEVSADLASKRALAMYGLEAAGKSPSELFGVEQAEKALGVAKMTIGLVEKLLRKTSS
ncbi:MAG: HEPN domain-containing protein [Thaumarchaeota archaeon]|nr:MAG: HEPN domain-containing protein [Nitrososphaerota archaeon]